MVGVVGGCGALARIVVVGQGLLVIARRCRAVGGCAWLLCVVVLLCWLCVRRAGRTHRIA